MKTKPKNEAVKGLIEGLHRQSFEKEAPVWAAVAKALNRPRRKGVSVNLFSIEKSAKAKDAVVVPGSVLGFGDVSKAVNVAALRFSASAKQKIENAGGKCMGIQDMAKSNPTGKGVRILG
jgi:large subunit ribosomal protein L18e